jgi:ElaB/YqjD/DUF883 family membrane-anchored ribosome-binding protein
MTSQGIEKEEEMTTARANKEAESMTAEAQERVADIRDKAREKGNEIRGQVSGELDHLGDVAKERAERAASAAEKAGDVIQDRAGAAAGYIEHRSMGDAWSDVRAYVRRHPGRALLIAVAGGLLVGKIMF